MTPEETYSLLEEDVQRNISELWRELGSGEMTAQEWRAEMGDLLALYLTSAWIAGGESDDPLDPDSLRNYIETQFAFLDNFAQQIEDSKDEDGNFVFAGTLSLGRAAMYGAALWGAYQMGKGAMWGEKSPYGLHLPAYPADGSSECKCITTPESRVKTTRGNVPISEIVIGDMVWTHKNRWRKVTQVYRHNPSPNHRQSWVTAPNGSKIGCTHDHKWLTPNGWKRIIDIDNSSFLMYHHGYEQKILHKVWRGAWQSKLARYLQELSRDLSNVRQAERLSGSGVHFLWNANESSNSVEEAPRKVPSWVERSWKEAANKIRGFVSRFQLAEENGREILRFLSRREREEVLHLSLSMGLDGSEWSTSSSARNDNSSPKQQSYRRQTRKPEIDDKIRSCQNARIRTGETNKVGPSAGVHLHRPALQRVLDLWQEIFSQETGKIAPTRAEILHNGLLSSGTTLYDIEVEEDHSFVIEGLVAHNSNDRCEWVIEPLNVEEGEYNAYWTLGVAEHCPTCLERAKDWNPLYIWHGWPVYRKEMMTVKERVIAATLKHLQGQHNQKRHGWRYGNLEATRRAMRAGVSSDYLDKTTPEAERASYRKRAGMAEPVKVQKKPDYTPERAMRAPDEIYPVTTIKKSSDAAYVDEIDRAVPLMAGNREKFLNASTDYILQTSSSLATIGTYSEILERARWNYQNATISERKSLKISIVDRLDRRLGDDYIDGKITDKPETEEVAKNIKEWAYTSNDSNPTALLLQKAAADTFGVSLSKWQVERVNEVMPKILESSPASRDKAYWKAVYTETQEFFKNAGYKPNDEITLYRGIKNTGVNETPTGKGNYEGNAVESWSLDVSVARGFSGSYGIIVSARIKVKDIISTFMTGPGCLTELEFIALGSRPNQEVYIYDLQNE